MAFPGLDFLFDISQYPARWHCGHWAKSIGWTYITSDLLIFLAYTGIPVSILYYRTKLKATALELNYIFYLFASFIFLCGSTHLIDAIVFWYPIYNFATLIKLLTALVSLATLVVIITMLPLTLNFITEQIEAKSLKLELETLKAAEAQRALVTAEERNAKLMELDKLKSDFLANVTHELRTPLTLIMGPLENILHDINSIPEKHRENLLRMQRNSNRLYGLVNDVLDFFKLEAGKVNVQKHLVDLNKQIDQIVFDAQGLAHDRKLSLTFSSCPELPVMLLDRKMIDKITMNLIGNAIKFTPEGGEIKVSLQKKEGNAQLMVKDSGIGIPETEIEHLFERFYQVDATHTRAYEGTGIGLALVSQFVQLLNGSISLESKQGEGTTFYIELPIEEAGLTGNEVLQNPENKTANEITSRLKTQHSKTEDIVLIDEAVNINEEKPYILVADDNEDMQGYIASLLMPSYKIIQVKDGQAALEAVRKYKPHLVLSDVMMPVMDGYEFTKTIKSDPEFRHIPVILITAKTSDQSASWSIDIGADDYLTKPFSPAELMARTASALRSYNAFNEVALLQSKLQKEKEIIQSVMAEGLCVFDNEWKIVYLNRTAEALLNCNSQKLIGKFWSDAFNLYEHYDLSKPIDLPLLEKTIMNEEVYNQDRAAISRIKVSTPIAFSISALPLNRDQKFNGAVLLFRDIKKQLQYEISLKDALKVAQASNAAKTSFLANMSHEIRTPLNGIMGMLQLLLATKLDEKQSQFVEKSYSASESLLKILGDILDYSKIDSYQMSLESVVFDFRKEINTCIEVLNPLLVKKNTKIAVNIDDELPSSIIGDPIRIKQIFTNLIGNAIKFTPEEGKISVNVVLAEMKDGFIKVDCAVSDNGIGIPLTSQATIFEMFSQADDSITRKYGGTGLGLAITKRLVELMGGQIEVISREGEGAIFKFDLKLWADKDTFIKDVSESIVQHDEMPQFPVDVLIVEDNELNQTVTFNMMKSLGCNQIDIASSGELALKAIKEKDYQLILMDCHMPGMDGLTATKKIRELEQQNKTEKKIIIALTANALAGMEERCLEAGMDAYVSKPLKFEYLTQILQKYLPS